MRKALLAALIAEDFNESDKCHCVSAWQNCVLLMRSVVGKALAKGPEGCAAQVRLSLVHLGRCPGLMTPLADAAAAAVEPVPAAATEQ